ncbi:MAG: radical SAM protein [Candidatus Omnitrophica bacterium]|nr:radical SAM protein [Candidatus Omnitrophota bacterium]MCM8777147.1 radical SAM protein [Candidatus Omnitrophota bacterium]
MLEKLRRIKERAEQLEKILTSCTLCPRKCKIDRTSEEKGVCGVGKDLVVSSYGPHFGEEPELVGIHGSGTIFLTHCNLLCIYCQNYEISHLGVGDIISEEKLSDVMLKLQKDGCHNINLVTPTHFTPQIVKSIKYAIEKGLDIPIVWNCSGYENVDIIKSLNGIVDIYMPDIKYSESEPAKKYSNAPDYFERCKESIEEMYRQVGDLKVNSSGIAEKGLLVRHLVLPDNLAGSEKVLRFIAGLSKNTYINIMDQYRPCGKAYLYPEINRRPTEEEFRQVLKIAVDLGLHRGFESI